MSAGQSARPASERREALKQLLAQARACERCSELAATRKTVVFGAGNADAELMFVGEAPGASEDEQGLPFVGRAGKLLDQLLAEIGMERKGVFVANVLKCRPPGNRDPLPIEIENCQDYLLRQVAVTSGQQRRIRRAVEHVLTMRNARSAALNRWLDEPGALRSPPSS